MQKGHLFKIENTEGRFAFEHKEQAGCKAIVSN
jgi:hypothetical protein